MKRKKVLIVDDEVIQSMALEELMQFWGYEVCAPAMSGDEALKKAGLEKADVVLMDVGIHGERSSLEVAGEIISGHGIPVIFMTAYEEELIYEKARKLNPLAYLIKPFELEELRAAIVAVPFSS